MKPDYPHEPAVGSGSRSRSTWVLIAFIAIAAFFLFTEHQAHVLGALPYLILLACPLMHIFMHRGHGGDTGHGGHEQRNQDRSREAGK